MLEHIDQLTEASARAISNIKFDKVVVWEGGNGNANGGLSGTAGFIQNMAKSMPPMMDVLRTVAGVELPAFLGTMTPETTPSAAPTAGNDTASGGDVALPR